MKTNKRELNAETLRYWLSQQGELAKENLAIATGIKVAKLDRFLCGRQKVSETEIIILCQVTRLEKDELFPITKQEKSA